MIKQKDIEKCKFFTTTGGDIWRTKKVRLITEVDLVNCETGRLETCRAGERSAERFVAIAIPRITSPRAAKKISHKDTKSQRKLDISKKQKNSSCLGALMTKKKNKRGIRKGQKPSSQYLGVTVKQQKIGPRYYAQISRGGKFKGLGIYNVEELAAAAVQEHLGNHEEAERLRKIAEQKTDTAIKELKGQVGQMLFLCNGCGADYSQKPEQCVKCGGGGFEEVQPDGKRLATRTRRHEDS